MKRVLAAVVVAGGLGSAAAGAYTTTLVTVRNLVVVNCNQETKTFCDAATPDGRLIVLYTGKERFPRVPRIGSRLDVRGFDVRDPSDAYLGVLALEVPTATGRTTMTRTGAAARIVVHGKVGRVTTTRVGFVSVRWVRSPVGGPVIGNVYERFSFRASAALRARARRLQWDRVQRVFDRETWAFTLRLDRGSYRLVGLRRDG